MKKNLLDTPPFLGGGARHNKGPVGKCILFRLMRITAAQILLMAFTMNLSIAGDGFAQEILNRRVTLEWTSGTLKDALTALENQVNVKFVYSGSAVELSELVTVTASSEKLGPLLDKLLGPLSIEYIVKNKVYIVLKPARAKSETDSITNSETENIEKNIFEITGRVTDGSSSEPLPGVNIIVKGTTIGTTTDSEGLYRLSVNDGSKLTLIFSFIGYQTREIEVAEQTVVDVSMTPEVQTLEEVVVVGYGTQKKVNLTGAVDVISHESLENRSPANIGALLQGASPSLNVSVRAIGGEPGADMDFSIRGRGTLTGSNSPLVLVDGVEMNIGNLDPETIESVSVLKDAASSAIYGSRAPFGVILITTKKGTRNKGMNISYSNNIAFASPTYLPAWQSSIRYVTAYNQALQNSGLPDKFRAPQIERINMYLAGTYTPEYDTINPPSYAWGGRHEGNANYDWVDMLFKDVVVNQKHNINFSGGDEKNQYYISTGYYDQGGSYSYAKEYYKRYNVLTNFTTQTTPWLRFNVSTKYAIEKQEHPNYYQDDSRAYLISELLVLYPITPMYNVNGTINNPIVNPMMKGGPAKSNENDLLILLGAELEPVKGWKTNINYGYNYLSGTNTYLDAEIWMEIPDGRLLNEGNSPNQFRQSWYANNYQAFNTTTSYEKTYRDHFFKAMIGFEREYKYFSNLGGYKKNLISEDVPSIRTATGEFNIYDEMSHSATEAVFGRLNYNYDEKYLLEVVTRYNGSSKFAKDSRWGFFPSVSVGYNIAKERFWEPLERYVNTFKLRANYGSLGNQNVSNYLYLSNIPINTNLESITDGKRPNYSSIPIIKSPTLTWETITMFDLGLDVDFFNNRLGLGFDWYERNTTQMFGPAEILPATLGANPPQENNSSIVTRGWEISLMWKDRINKDLNYSARVILSDNRTHVTRYLNDEGLIDNWYVGKEVGEIWGYTTAGLLQTDAEAAAMPDQSFLFNKWGPGDVKYVDLNGDGKIDPGTSTLDDRGDLSVIGNTSPRYNLGFTAGVKWKNFDFSTFWYGILKRDLPTQSSWGHSSWWGVGTRGDGGGVLFQGHDDYWRPAEETNLFGPNTDGYFPKPYITEETHKNQAVQTRYLRSTAFFQLKNIQLGYTIPQEITEKIRVQSLKLYVSAENLITFDKVPPYINPEEAHSHYDWAPLGAIYPISKSFSAGLNVTF